VVLSEISKLTASDTAASDRFGNSVAMDGDTMVVGAYRDDDSGIEDSGSAYVFTLTGTTWTQQAKLTASDGAAFDQFGNSVAIAGDTIVVCAPWGDTDNGDTSGSAYVFTLTGTTWTEQAKLTASDGAAGDEFGRSVAIAGDTIVVGARLDDDNGENSGSAYVFTRTGTTWMEQAKLTASDGAEGDWSGFSVAISGDTIVVGAWMDDDNGTSSGSAHVYTRTEATWMEQAKLTASDAAANDNFGISVAIAGDTIVVGADSTGIGNGITDSGSAYVYSLTGTSWTEQAKLRASNPVLGDQFGTSVAISGNTIVVGALENALAGTTGSGSSYVFTRTGTTWMEQAKLTASDGAFNDDFGHSVAIAGDTIVVGANRDDDNGADSGSVYIYDLNV